MFRKFLSMIALILLATLLTESPAFADTHEPTPSGIPVQIDHEPVVITREPTQITSEPVVITRRPPARAKAPAIHKHPVRKPVLQQPAAPTRPIQIRRYPVRWV